MIRFGPMSVTLLVCAVQALALAAMLLRLARNARANRFLAGLILAFVALITPYIIGYAGFYDRWPGLSFAPFELTLAFGPLLFFYVAHLVGAEPGRAWPHFAPAAIEFASQALVFPLPLSVKDRWDDAVPRAADRARVRHRRFGLDRGVRLGGAAALPVLPPMAP